METATQSNELIKIIDSSNLDSSIAVNVKDKFLPFFEQANEWKTKALALTVTDVSQKKEMAEARVARLALKDIRVNVEKRRKEMKAESLRTGQAIDGVANVLKGLIEPIEQHLQKQEDFAAVQEAKRVAALQLERSEKIKHYVDESTFVALTNLGTMPDTQFNTVFLGYKTAYENKIAEEKKVEEDRIAKEKSDAEEREKQRLENERLKAEALQKEKELAEERLKVEAEKKALQDKADAEAKRLKDIADKEKKEIEAKAAKEREEAEAKLKVEREAKVKLEKELKDKQDAEAKVEKERIAAEKKAAKAPDKTKLISFAELVDGLYFQYPEVKSDEAKKILSDTKVLIDKLSAFIKEKAQQL